MRIKLLFFFLCFFSIYHAKGQANIKSVLILGDSNLKGHFGEFLQKRMHETGKYDIISIAIGGAGSKTFVPIMKNECCGYRVRQTCAGEPLIINKKAKTTKIKVLERAEKPTSGVVMKWFGGKLLPIMNFWKPDAIIIVLGTNYLDSHEDLLKQIKKYRADIPIIWIGPFDAKSSASRYSRIEKALSGIHGSFLIKSDTIASKLGITPDHVAGVTAKKLSDAIFKQFEPVLENDLSKKSEWIQFPASN